MLPASRLDKSTIFNTASPRPRVQDGISLTGSLTKGGKHHDWFRETSRYEVKGVLQQRKEGSRESDGLK